MILAIDQGTSGSTCLIVDQELTVRGRASVPVSRHYPRPGWVEQDPEEIWRSVVAATEQSLADAGVAARDVQAIGITNQRETTLLWDRSSGKAVHPAIVWQDRRTAERCRELAHELIRTRTGLVPDPYFSATKLEWLLRDRNPDRLAFGTVDSWLVWKLTGGRVHATDVTNASRTMLLRLDTLGWDDELLELFGVERSLLPELRGSSEVVGEGALCGISAPIAGICGDQQASLFGHGCFEADQAKATYGTGTFVLVHTGTNVPAAPHGIIATAAAGEHEYALEGSIFTTGAAVQWLREGLGLVADPGESEALAAAVHDNGGVYFVPALAGLGSPYWRPDARGVITGLTFDTRREHLVRAAVESIAYQMRDVIDAMGIELDVLRVDGGATANRFLMQFQADVLRIPVEVAAERETTAIGAAALAGLAVGAFGSRHEIADALSSPSRYEPQLDEEETERLVRKWRQAVKTAVGVPPAGIEPAHAV